MYKTKDYVNINSSTLITEFSYISPLSFLLATSISNNITEKK